jgi:hypothetical protein
MISLIATTIHQTTASPINQAPKFKGIGIIVAGVAFRLQKPYVGANRPNLQLTGFTHVAEALSPFVIMIIFDRNLISIYDTILQKSKISTIIKLTSFFALERNAH